MIVQTVTLPAGGGGNLFTTVIAALSHFIRRRYRLYRGISNPRLVSAYTVCAGGGGRSYRGFRRAAPVTPRELCNGVKLLLVGVITPFV